MKVTIHKHGGIVVEDRSTTPIRELVAQYGVISVHVGYKSVAQLQMDGMTEDQIADYANKPDDPKPSPATPYAAEGRAYVDLHDYNTLPKYDSKFNPRPGAVIPYVTFAKGQDRIPSQEEVDKLAERFGADGVFLDGVPFNQVLAANGPNDRGWDQRCYVENQRAELEADRVNAAPREEHAIDPAVTAENEARSLAAAKDRLEADKKPLSFHDVPVTNVRDTLA